jgi:hypothetical protein
MLLDKPDILRCDPRHLCSQSLNIKAGGIPFPAFDVCMAGRFVPPNSIHDIFTPSVPSPLGMRFRSCLMLFTSFEILRRPVRRSRGASSRMLHKCLSARRISRVSCAASLRCGSSASSRTLFRPPAQRADANCLRFAATRLKFAA